MFETMEVVRCLEFSHAPMIEFTAVQPFTVGLVANRMVKHDNMSTFVAIDFEIANHRRGQRMCGWPRFDTLRQDQGCAVVPDPAPRGAVRVTEIMASAGKTCAMRLPSANSGRTLHTWVDDAEFIAAHNAPFDRSILLACCATYGIQAPRCRSPVRSSLLVRMGSLSDKVALMSAAGFVSLCVTMTPSPMRRRVAPHRARCQGRGMAAPVTVTTSPTKHRRCGSSRLCLRRYTRSG